MDIDFVRAQFPALETPWALMDNAGGSAPCRQVIDRVRVHMERLPVQLGASYPQSVDAGAAVQAGRASAAELINARADEVVLGASSTVLAAQLAGVLRSTWAEGDEVIVTNLDHEANVGPWARLERSGIVVREWKVNPDTLELDVGGLEPLLGPRTRLVAFTHCSNVVGTITDVAAIAGRVRAAGALSCVDGVAYAPHRRVDVRALGVDFYLLSLYKVYGPHLGLMFGRRELLAELPHPNHFFVSEQALPTKFEPGNVNYELAASLTGIVEYLRAAGGSEDLGACFEGIAKREQDLIEPLLSLLERHPRVELVGRADPDRSARVPTVSFTWGDRRASELTPLLDERRLAARHGHFYAYRLIRDLGLMERDGVVRVSLLHYNTEDEVARLIGALEELLGG